MKKFYLSIFAALSALSVLSCAKDLEVNETAADSNVREVSLVAEFCKTSNDGVGTNWVANDAINVFHILDSDYQLMDWSKFNSDGKFSIAADDLAAGTFRGSITLEDAPVHFYAFYPYKSQLTSPNNSNIYYYPIGSKNSSTAQVQDGNNSKAHLAGEYFPVYARCESTWDSKASGSNPISLQFKQALSVVEFNVTNNSGSDLKVSGVSMYSEQEELTGTFYINFAGEKLVFKGSGATYVSNTASLTVNNGEVIAPGASAKFYLAIKPFVNEAGKTLKFAVNGYEKTVTSAMTFSSGAIKTVNFSYDKTVRILEEGTYVALIENSGKNYFAMSSTDDGASTKRFKAVNVVYDGGAVFKTSDASIVWNVTKEDGAYLFENGGKYISWPDDGNSAEMSDSPYELNVVEDEDYFKVSSVAATSRILSKNNSGLFFAFYANTSQKYKFTFVPAELSTGPMINPISDPEKLDSAGETVDVAYTITNPVAGRTITASCPESWISLDTETAGIIKVTAAENELTEERSAVVTVKYEGAEDVTFTVTQKKLSSAVELTFGFTKAVSGWPTAKASAKAGDYKYTLGGVDYVFTHSKDGNGIYCSSGYLMVNSSEKLGLPIVSGKKLVEVVAKNSSGCSTTVKVSITDGLNTVKGGEAQTWSATSSTYTYSLSDTTAGTRYYINIVSKNCQIIELTLTYE